VWLILLAVSAFTARFSTCELTDTGDGRSLPFERLIHKDPVSKLDAASDISIALAATFSARPPALDVVLLSPASDTGQSDHRRVRSTVLRL